MIPNAFKYRRSNQSPCSIVSGNAGFTLAELVLAMGVMLMVFGAIISLFTSLNRAYTTQNAAAGAQQVARAGIDIMTRSIRMAGLNPLNLTPIGIVQAAPDSIRFQYDTNASGTIATNGDEDVAYLRNNKNQLIRQKNGNSDSNRSLVDNVTDLRFKYLDANGDFMDTNDLTAIRGVEVSLAVREPAGRDRPLSRRYTTRVICRNLNLQ